MHCCSSLEEERRQVSNFRRNWYYYQITIRCEKMTVIFYLFWIYLGFGKRVDFEFFRTIRREITVEKLPKKSLLASSKVFSRLKQTTCMKMLSSTTLNIINFFQTFVSVSKIFIRLLYSISCRIVGKNTEDLLFFLSWHMYKIKKYYNHFATSDNNPIVISIPLEIRNLLSFLLQVTPAMAWTL